MECNAHRHAGHDHGSVLVVVVMVFFLLSLIGIALMTIAFGVRQRAARLRNEAMAMVAAEAGYEQGVLWMSQQRDILGGLATNAPGASGANNFGLSRFDYAVTFHDYIGGYPVFRVISNGYCNVARRVVDVLVLLAPSGWDMGMCRIPYSATGASTTTSSTPVNFASGEVIDMKIHINELNDSPDNRDIYITGSPPPLFLKQVEMGESYTSSKYPSTVMNLFLGGVLFDQPDVLIADPCAVQSKLDRFRNSTNPDFVFSDEPGANNPMPMATSAALPNPASADSAVQIEFFVESGVGKVRITNNCTVQTYKRGNVTHDYAATVDVAGNMSFYKYPVYAYHYKCTNPPEPTITANIDHDHDPIYVVQTFMGRQSEPCGQIYVKGNVILGSETYGQLVVKGKVTIVATGNIWIADSIVVDGSHDAVTGMPTPDNINALGLIAKGVIKVIDPGMPTYVNGGTNGYPGPIVTPITVTVGGVIRTYSYVPVANPTTAAQGGGRVLPHEMVVEAAITVGGGGWGAENVRDGAYGGRRAFTEAANPSGGNEAGNQDFLVVHGTIVEVVRGVVGLVGTDGFLKKYTFDKRMQYGVLPGNIWFGGKYIPAPAGWHDYRPVP
jgi:hypothetical protein